MMGYVFQKGVYDILLEIKKHGKIQPSKLAELIKSISEKTLYKRLEELAMIGLIKKEAGFNEFGRPVTLYSLTPLGEEVIKRFIDVEKILKRGYKTPSTA
jgi:DNA-binding HxlR family transcriptional regulator